LCAEDAATPADRDPSARASSNLLTLLTTMSEAESSTLRDRFEVCDSMFSKHLAALEGSTHVRRRKGVHPRPAHDLDALTPRNRRALGDRVEALRELVDAVD
jgi:hypothetical protein